MTVARYWLKWCHQVLARAGNTVLLGPGCRKDLNYLSGFMKTWLQWVSKGRMLNVSLVPRLWPSPSRTMGDCLHLPLSSAIIIIIILSRGLIQLARANYTEHCCLLKGLCQNSTLPTPLVLTPRSTHPVVGCSLGYSALPTKPPSPLLVWTPDWPGARRKRSGHVLMKSDRYWTLEYCRVFPGLFSSTDQAAKPPTCSDAGLAWSRAKT